MWVAVTLRIIRPSAVGLRRRAILVGTIVVAMFVLRDCPTVAQPLPAQILLPAVRLEMAEISNQATDGSDPNISPGEIVVPFGADLWQYSDGGTPPDAQWREPDFEAEDWKSGVAPFGYGDDDLKTVVSFGDDREQKPITTYFRKKFDWKKSDNVAGCSIRLVVDDGAVVYLNGKEVVRKHLPAGEVVAETTTDTAISGETERQKWLFAIDASLLVEGSNVLAAEVHQCNASSSDLAFDLEFGLLNQEQVVTWQELVTSEQQRWEEIQRRAALAVEAPVLNVNEPEVNQYYFSDGEVTYNMADGRTITQRSDAVQQIGQSFPFIRFARALAGDTIEKIALQNNFDPEILCKTNRVAAGHVYREDEAVCLRWRHRVVKGETIESIAKLYSMEPTTLLAMNQLAADAALKENQVLNVAGRYDHQIPATKQQGQGHLMLTVVNSQMNMRNSAYVPVGRGIQTHQVAEGETIASLTEQFKLKPNFLRQLNRMGDDEEIEVGDRIMTSYLVRLNDGMTYDDVCFAHGLEIEDILEANDVTSLEELTARNAFHLPSPIQRSDVSGGVITVDGGFF